MGQVGMRLGRETIPGQEARSPGTYHRSVGMGDPKNGQSSRVRLYRITLMSWFRGDSIRGGTSVIPELLLGGGQLCHLLPLGLMSTCLLLTAALKVPTHLPNQPPSFKKPLRVRGGRRSFSTCPQPTLHPVQLFQRVSPNCLAGSLLAPPQLQSLSQLPPPTAPGGPDILRTISDPETH